MDGGLETNRARESESQDGAVAALPEYLQETYWWAYLTPVSLALFDNPVFLTLLLWGHLPRLVREACAEIEPGQRVLQAASVYGNLSAELAKTVGENGKLSVIDVAPLQVEHCRRKVSHLPQAQVFVADAAKPRSESFDAVCCFFLLHEVPDSYKRNIVDALLQAVPEGGCAVFIDYHRPKRWHPLGWPMRLVFRWLEPFAHGLIDREVSDFAGDADRFVWQKQTFFGGMYQKVVARRLPIAGVSA